MNAVMDRWKQFLPTVARKVGMRPYAGHRLLLVQPLREDTLRLVETLLPFFEIDAVIGAGCARPQVAATLDALGITVRAPHPGAIDAVVRETLATSLDRARRDGKKLLIVEAGGHATAALHRHFPRALGEVAACIETTQAGVERAARSGPLGIAHRNVAESGLKRVQSLLVGDAVASALEQLLQVQGWTLAGRRVLVAGYTPIGRGTARALRRRDAVVGVHDPNPLRLVEAKVEGHLTPSLRDWLPLVSLVVGAAGETTTITAGVIALLPDGAAIASGGAREGDVDRAALESRADSTEEVAEGVRRFRMRDGRSLYLLNEGRPVHCTGTRIPAEAVDLVSAEVLVLLHALATAPHPHGMEPIDPALETVPAMAWLEMRDPHFRALAAAA